MQFPFLRHHHDPHYSTFPRNDNSSPSLTTPSTTPLKPLFDRERDSRRNETTLKCTLMNQLLCRLQPTISGEPEAGIRRRQRWGRMACSEDKFMESKRRRRQNVSFLRVYHEQRRKTNACRTCIVVTQWLTNWMTSRLYSFVLFRRLPPVSVPTSFFSLALPRRSRSSKS